MNYFVKYSVIIATVAALSVTVQKVVTKQPNTSTIWNSDDFSGKYGKIITIEGYLSSEWIGAGPSQNQTACWTLVSEQPLSISPDSRYIGVELGFYVVPEPNPLRRIRITGMFEKPANNAPPRGIGGMMKVYNIELLDTPQSIVEVMAARDKSGR